MKTMKFKEYFILVIFVLLKLVESDNNNRNGLVIMEDEPLITEILNFNYDLPEGWDIFNIKLMKKNEIEINMDEEEPSNDDDVITTTPTNPSNSTNISTTPSYSTTNPTNVTYISSLSPSTLPSSNGTVNNETAVTTTLSSDITESIPQLIRSGENDDYAALLDFNFSNPQTVGLLSKNLTIMKGRGIQLSFSVLLLGYDWLSSTTKNPELKIYIGDKIFFNSNDYALFFQSKKNWANFKLFINEDGVSIPDGSILNFEMRRWIRQVVALDDIEYNVVKLFDNDNYNPPTTSPTTLSPTTTLPTTDVILSTTTNRPSNDTTEAITPSDEPSSFHGSTSEIVLICLVIVLSLFSIIISYRHWVLKMNLGEYQVYQTNKNNRNSGTQPYSNPVFSGHGIPAERYGTINE